MKKTIWSAKVHTSGTKIQLLKNGNVTKVIKASDGNFSPENAQKFAQNLITGLNNKYAKQMTNPGADPSVDTPADEQAKSMKSVSQDAKGISPKEASLHEENITLKKKIAKLEKSAAIERKARRGLAIAKTLVAQKKLANDEKAIKDQVMKVVAMSNEEIGLFERKVAGLPLYNSSEEALRASRRYARLSRLHKQAAEDAQLAGDDDLADLEDTKAARYEDLSKEATSPCESEVITDDTAAIEPEAAVDDDELIDDVSEDDLDNEEELIDDSEDFDVQAAASIYRKIASSHRTKAEEFRKSGNNKEAAVEDEIADESDALADSVESTDSNESPFEEEASDENITKQAASIYRKIAADHRKKADDFEAAGETEKADEEDEIADEAEQMAKTVEGCSKVGVEEETPIETPTEISTETAAVETPTEIPIENKDAAKETETNIEDKTSNTDEDAEKDNDDPLAALLSEKDASEEDDVELGDDLSDDMITAALADEDSNENEENVVANVDDSEIIDETVEKEASNNSKKIANEGYHQKSASADTIEQNSAVSDPQVKEIETMLWR